MQFLFPLKSITYLRILDRSFASSSENIGIALDLCSVPIPTMLPPVYEVFFDFVHGAQLDSRLGMYGVSRLATSSPV